MIKQVLINLLSNAVKYSSKNAKPEIEIGSEEEDARIIYYVKDNGVGLPQGFSFENSRSLGMEIINSLSEQICATVNYTSTQHGTEFLIRFNPKIKLQ